MFNIFINDLDENIKSTILLKFADDTKVGQVIEEEEDSSALQSNLDQLCSWARKWGMRFNEAKCRVMHFGRNNPRYPYTMNGVRLETTEEEKDLGVLICSNLKVGKQCERAAKTGMSVLAQLLRAFTYRSKSTLPKLFQTYMRPHLEYAIQAWSPWQVGDVDELEKVQKKMVSAVTGLAGTTYEEKLAELGMLTLSARRAMLDLQQAYKIISKQEDLEPTTWFQNIGERNVGMRLAAGGLNLAPGRARLECRRHFFSQRVVEPWNRLSCTTQGAKTLYEFKKKIRA